jgi:hypothetical protein
MPLANRLLNAVITLQSGTVVTLDQTLQMRVRINKASLDIQNRATIEVYGLTRSLREQLLSQFTLWNRTQFVAGRSVGPPVWAPVTISAGWSTVAPAGSNTGQGQQITPVFVGQVAYVEIISGPPNVGIRLTCYTRQLDKTAFPASPAPYTGTFKNFVAWAANEMGFGTNNYICQTSHDNDPANNLGGEIYTIGSILPAIQNAWMPNVAAFVDDDFLTVKDRSTILNAAATQTYSEFVGIPSWTEYGVEFTTLFDPTIRLAQGATLQSALNPSLNGSYVVMEIEYDLTSREEAFYGKVNANPPA